MKNYFEQLNFNIDSENFTRFKNATSDYIKKSDMFLLKRGEDYPIGKLVKFRVTDKTLEIHVMSGGSGGIALEKGDEQFADEMELEFQNIEKLREPLEVELESSFANFKNAKMAELEREFKDKKAAALLF